MLTRIDKLRKTETNTKFSPLKVEHFVKSQICRKSKAREFNMITKLLFQYKVIPIPNYISYCIYIHFITKYYCLNPPPRNFIEFSVIFTCFSVITDFTCKNSE